MLKLKDIVKIYKVADTEVHALKGINLNFRKNEFVSILGPSGCGKTTMLNIIGGLDKYTSGDLFINGRSTKEFKDRDWDVYRNHRIGFIFQSYNLIPHQTILGNVELALTIAGISKAERIERAKKALDKVGLSGQYNKHANQLSGGQCQRVAIARALVNEPEILLADEPTGALDTVTSVQIMDLIKEIAKERLVIMVTHNPDLAEKYSTRIIKLLDGEVLDDSNPFSEEDEASEIEELVKAEEAQFISETEAMSPEEIEIYKKKKAKEKEKAKMSFWTAFKLSARNLYSKLKRTVLVVIAGSIGIIGVSAVLAVSQGVRDYITSIQDDLLSGNPIQVTKSGIDYETLINSSSFLTRSNAAKEATKDGEINVNSAVTYLIENEKALDSLTYNNEFDRNYINYLLNMPKEYYNAISMRYDMDISFNMYTDFRVSHDENNKDYAIKHEFDKAISLDAINQTYAKSLTNVLDALNYDSKKAETYASLITGLSKPVSQSINFENDTYLKTQYDLVAGNYPKENNEMLLVLDNDGLISDLSLAQLGYYSWEEFYDLIYEALNTSRNYNPKITTSSKKESFTYDELKNKEFRWYPNDTVFTKSIFGGASSGLVYSYEEPSNKDGMITFKVSGIVKLKDGINYGALKSGFYYSETVAKEMIKRNINSEINKYIKSTIEKNDGNINSDSVKSDISYELKYYWEALHDDQTLHPFNDAQTLDERNNKKTINVGEGDTTSSLTSLFVSGESMNTIEDSIKKFITALTPMIKDDQIDIFNATMDKMIDGILTSSTTDKKIYLKTFGGTYIPNSIQIYPINFDNKDLVTNYLDRWNKIEGDFDENTLKKVKVFNEDFSAEIPDTYINITPDQRQEVKYTDQVGLIINLINTMIDIVTYALVGFTALSLVVSTVMIAIITYVSVMERVKEIGVIRSLGGRKKDVSHLFNAEAFILGLTSGVFGIIITYILELFGNIIVNFASGGTVARIANLTPLTAVIMILVSILLTTISGVMPARSAAKKDPVVALRTE